tara:strand:+ start:7960 stop:8220 length:261 start_codon:yes stop_codon:yes gene_type:complete
MSSDDKKLIGFLKNLTTSLEDGKLCKQQVQRIGEFFMSYQFQESADRDRNTTEQSPEQFSKEDMIKFLSLGWYVYQILLRNDSLPE